MGSSCKSADMTIEEGSYAHIRFIAHAGGSAQINRKIYKKFNCKEGFEQHYAAGNRVFEMDFDFSEDRELVCLHGWDVESCGSGFSSSNRMTCKQWSDHKIQNCLTSLSFRSVLDLLRKYPDAEICMDNKTDRSCFKEYSEYLHKVLTQQPDCEDLSARLCPEVFSVEMYEYMDALHPQFVHYHYSNRPRFPTPEEMKHCPKIRAFSLCANDLTPEIVAKVKAMGKCVNAWTVDSPIKARKYIRMGADFITSNTITGIEHVGLKSEGGTLPDEMGVGVDYDAADDEDSSGDDVESQPAPGDAGEMKMCKAGGGRVGGAKNEGGYGVGAPVPPPPSGKYVFRSGMGKYLSAQKNGKVEWNRDAPGSWEQVECAFMDSPDHINPVILRSCHGKYLSAQKNGELLWDRKEAKGWEIFSWRPQAGGKFALVSAHGRYVSVCADGKVVADKAEAKGTETFEYRPASE